MDSAIPYTSLQDTLRDLTVERDAHITRAGTITEAIDALTRLNGHSPAGFNGNGYTHNLRSRFADTTVGNAAAQVLREQGPLPTTALADAILDGGYETDSDNFTQVVYVTLANNPKRFGRVARGVWEARRDA